MLNRGYMRVLCSTPSEAPYAAPLGQKGRFKVDQVELWEGLRNFPAPRFACCC
jgi:hypothetical protein